MSWNTGNSLLMEIIDDLGDSTLPHTQRVLVYEILIEKFENYDCVINSCDLCGNDPAFDDAMSNLGHAVDLDENDEEEEELEFE